MIQRIDLLLLFISLTLLLLGLMPTTLEYSGTFFIIVLFVVGIPHGSLDHLIHAKNTNTQPGNISFYTRYLSLFFLVGLSWFFFPSITFIIFLLLSAYHFGQSQLYNIQANKFIEISYQLSWGVMLLASIIYFNLAECMTIFSSMEWLNTSWISVNLLVWSTLASSIIFIGLHSYFFIRSKITLAQYLFEGIVLLILISMAFWTSAVFTFTVYFGLWHSLRSLILEYETIKTTPAYNWKAFIKDVIPFSVLGLFFLFIAYWTSMNFNLGISFYMIFIIIISTLTVPHLLVMYKLYTK